ncbi:MAG: hypothetical protein IPM49_05920 [Flavobacteriales bacterium]|nr:hypothetical protein [Flavobacteriales bacterium]
MRTLLFLLLASLFGVPAQGQQIHVQAGMLRSEFLYKDSKGQRLEGLVPLKNFAMSAGIRRPFKRFDSKWFYLLGATYEVYATRGTSQDAYQNYYEWKATYAGISAGIERDLLTIRSRRKNNKGTTLFARAAVNPAFLIKGSQTLNNEVFDLRGTEQFNAPYLFGRATVGANYCVSNRVAVIAEYTFAQGLRMPINVGDDEEKLGYRAHVFTTGILIALNNCRYCLTQFAK